VKRLWSFLFGTPSSGQDTDEMKQDFETQRRDLDQRSDANRARLTEIQVAVQARRSDTDA
jgi:hypothetical protein